MDSRLIHSRPTRETSYEANISHGRAASAEPKTVHKLGRLLLKGGTAEKINIGCRVHTFDKTLGEKLFWQSNYLAKIAKTTQGEAVKETRGMKTWTWSTSSQTGDHRTTLWLATKTLCQLPFSIRKSIQFHWLPTCERCWQVLVFDFVSDALDRSWPRNSSKENCSIWFNSSFQKHSSYRVPIFHSQIAFISVKFSSENYSLHKTLCFEQPNEEFARYMLKALIRKQIRKVTTGTFALAQQSFRQSFGSNILLFILWSFVSCVFLSTFRGRWW